MRQRTAYSFLVFYGLSLPWLLGHLYLTYDSSVAITRRFASEAARTGAAPPARERQRGGWAALAYARWSWAPRSSSRTRGSPASTTSARSPGPWSASSSSGAARPTLDGLPRPTLAGFAAFAFWYVLQVVLASSLPGRTGYGAITPAGDRLAYRLNGFLAWIVTHVVLYLMVFQWGLIPATTVADHLRRTPGRRQPRGIPGGRVGLRESARVSRAVPWTARSAAMRPATFAWASN